MDRIRSGAATDEPSESAALLNCPVNMTIGPLGIRSAFKSIYFVAFVAAIAQLFEATMWDASRQAFNLAQGLNRTLLVALVWTLVLLVCLHLFRLYITLEKLEDGDDLFAPMLCNLGSNFVFPEYLLRILIVAAVTLKAFAPVDNKLEVMWAGLVWLYLAMLLWSLLIIANGLAKSGDSGSNMNTPRPRNSRQFKALIEKYTEHSYIGLTFFSTLGFALLYWMQAELKGTNWLGYATALILSSGVLASSLYRDFSQRRCYYGQWLAEWVQEKHIHFALIGILLIFWGSAVLESIQFVVYETIGDRGLTFVQMLPAESKTTMFLGLVLLLGVLLDLAGRAYPSIWKVNAETGVGCRSSKLDDFPWIAVFCSVSFAVAIVRYMDALHLLPSITIPYSNFQVHDLGNAKVGKSLIVLAMTWCCWRAFEGQRR